MSKYGDFLSSIEDFQKALSKKDRNYRQNPYKICSQASGELKLEFEPFC